jgi:hypothetical protein
MIIELPKFVSKEEVAFISNGVKPYLPETSHTYNRDGKSVFITKTPELSDVDSVISKIIMRLQVDVVNLYVVVAFCNCSMVYCRTYPSLLAWFTFSLLIGQQ